MDKTEAKSEIGEIVLYLLDTDDKDVVNHYSDMITEVLQQYADEQSREQIRLFIDYCFFPIRDEDFDRMYNKWLEEQKRER